MSAPAESRITSNLFNLFDQYTIQKLRDAEIYLEDPALTETIQWRLGISNGSVPWQREAKKSLDASQIVFTCVQTAKGNGGQLLRDKFDPTVSKTKKKGIKVDRMQIMNDALKVIQ